ncbi:MAG: hypothetical protein JRJ85_09010 [Deltaproteobacteria bacterium]|nr:hypothetical protein [Deltaproteobacteria bacterium]
MNDTFSEDTRRFWATMMEAELEHAALFRNIREKAKQDEDTQIDLNIQLDQLRDSYKKIKVIEQKAVSGDISDTKAFGLGAFIEEGLFEFSYSKRVRSNNPDVMKKIRKVENDTKQHYMLLHNYALEGV